MADGFTRRISSDASRTPRQIFQNEAISAIGFLDPMVAAATAWTFAAGKCPRKARLRAFGHGSSQRRNPWRITTEMALITSAGDTGEARLREAIARDPSAVRPQVELVANDELLKLGPPHKIPRTAKA